MCRVACMRLAHDVAVTCAIAILFCSFLGTVKCNNQNTYSDACVVKRVMYFEYGLYLFCVACMIYAFDVAVTFAIATLSMSKKKKMQNYKNV